jgi:hypothetical protein
MSSSPQSCLSKYEFHDPPSEWRHQQSQRARQNKEMRKRHTEFPIVAHQKRFAGYLLPSVDARQRQTRVAFISREYFMLL